MCPPGSGPGADKENIQVIETDYVKFALVLSLRQASNQNITRVSLLGEPLLPWALCMTVLKGCFLGVGQWVWDSLGTNTSPPPSTESSAVLWPQVETGRSLIRQ